MPNAESALNEEAGKLLLEHYDDYFQRAKMMTEIHAQVAFQLFFCVSFCSFPFLLASKMQNRNIRWSACKKTRRRQEVDSGEKENFKRQKENA